MKNYEKEYYGIVKNQEPKKYQDPESQGRSIKKCSILEPTKEISYRNHTVLIEKEQKS